MPALNVRLSLSHVLVWLFNFHRFMVFHHDELSEPVFCFEPTSVLNALDSHLDSAVTIFLPICKEG